ncbi:hypothetical protein [Planctomycetes bacterium TBK1r]|uniref:hypothetical protein n=1 Tax=Stieleria magnilauensis TaxID=2527963 RepID=UPI0011A2A0D5
MHLRNHGRTQRIDRPPTPLHLQGARVVEAAVRSHYEVRYARNKKYKLYDNGDLYDTISDVMETQPLPIDNADAEQQSARRTLQHALDSFPNKGQAIHHDCVSSDRKPGYQKRSNH